MSTLTDIQQVEFIAQLGELDVGDPYRININAVDIFFYATSVTLIDEETVLATLVPLQEEAQ